MIIVLGSVLVSPDRVGEALAISQAHVLRSRAEPGCIEHGVSIDVEQANRLVFVERWGDLDALRAHFKVPASREFVHALTALALAPPLMSLYAASEVDAVGKTIAAAHT
jgi:quinol monooxygenase YgiN